MKALKSKLLIWPYFMGVSSLLTSLSYFLEKYLCSIIFDSYFTRPSFQPKPWGSRQPILATIGGTQINKCPLRIFTVEITFYWICLGTEWITGKTGKKAIKVGLHKTVYPLSNLSHTKFGVLFLCMNEGYHMVFGKPFPYKISRHLIRSKSDDVRSA